MQSPSPARTVHCADALTWLAQQGTLGGCSVVTSLPDVSEVGLSLEPWKRWFGEAAGAVLRAIPDDGVAVFYQSDLKKGGVWTDKSYLVMRAAEAEGVALLWHKVVLRMPPGTISHGRPGYSHMLCFSRGIREDLGKASADVLPDAGEMTWVRAMGLEACAAALGWIAKHTRTRVIVDPFCGVGTALAAANALGFDAVGVELNRKRAKQARELSIARSVHGAPPEI